MRNYSYFVYFIYLKMHLPKCLCMSLLLMIADGFVVQSPSGPLVVPLGGSVVLPCSVDTLLPVEGLEVEWKKDSETLVHFFEDGESRPESQHEDYYDRAHFFTEEIQHGNFSLLLTNVRAEDKGEYRCKVYSDQESGENVVEIKYEHLIVSGSNHTLFPYEGEDITLSCSVDSHIPPEEIEEVSWKKTDKNGEILVMLFQYNEIITEVTPDQYKDRAEFFADEIPKANFSVRLKSVRTEDKGVYMCLVFAGDFSANTTVEVKIGLSTLHIVVLLLCGLAFGSASLLGCLVCYKCLSGGFSGFSVLRWSFHLLPNLFMGTAFIIWGSIDGARNEVISCSTLNLLRPLLLIVTVPQEVSGSRNQAPSIGMKHAIFSVVFYSVLLHNALERWAFYHSYDVGIGFSMFAVAVIWLSAIIYGGCRMKGNHMNREWRHALFIRFSNIPTICLLYYSFGQTHEEILILPLVVGVVVIFLMIARTCECDCIRFHKFGWSMLILIFVLLESGVMIHYHYSVLEHEKDRLEWTCVAAFVQTLAMMVPFRWDEDELKDLSRFVMYMVGAVGLIFLNSFALGTQLILNAQNSEIIQEDLRVIIFPAESAFVLCWLAYLSFSYSQCDVSCFKVIACKKRKCLDCWKKPQNKHRSTQKDAEDPSETHELGTMSL